MNTQDNSVLSSVDVNPDSIQQFLDEYYNDNQYVNQRLGQAFCNKFHLTNPKLFYSSDRKDTLRMIYQMLETV